MGKFSEAKSKGSCLDKTKASERLEKSEQDNFITSAERDEFLKRTGNDIKRLKNKLNIILNEIEGNYKTTKT